MFAKHYKKYREFKDRQIKLLEEPLLRKLSLEDQSKQRKEEMGKMQRDFA